MSGFSPVVGVLTHFARDRIRPADVAVARNLESGAVVMLQQRAEQKDRRSDADEDRQKYSRLGGGGCDPASDWTLGL